MSSEISHLVASPGVTWKSGVSQTSVSNMLTLIGPTLRLPVVAGFSVSNGPAQPTTILASLSGAAIAGCASKQAANSMNGPWRSSSSLRIEAAGPGGSRVEPSSEHPANRLGVVL